MSSNVQNLLQQNSGIKLSQIKTRIIFAQNRDSTWWIQSVVSSFVKVNAGIRERHFSEKSNVVSLKSTSELFYIW